ncbi:glycosyltransferase family protein [Rhizobium terrae]|uniref:hypothetical protein n=1 Tax=Rhizobium terrae TaxID=2171756 RepID=UPI000E3DD7E8|nr:hypothetical protein [Rhizobium terrae]
MAGDRRETLLSWLEHRLLRPMPRKRKYAAPRRVARIIVFGQFPNPTYDYYFAARLAETDVSEILVVDIRDRPMPVLDPVGAAVIICRYMSGPILDWIEENARELAAVCLFIDDDIPALLADQEASLGYRWRLFIRAIWPIRRLNQHLDILWTSTEVLASRHRHATVLPPAPLLEHSSSNRLNGGSSTDSDIVTIGYHGTSIHIREHFFLKPIIERVLQDRPQARFEVFVNSRSKAVWRNMERVSVRRQVSWPEYLAEASSRSIDIFLVPLLPSRTNDCRASTKKIDVARYGAAAIFSACPAYGATDGDEIRLPNDPALWYSRLIALIDDPHERSKIAQATRMAVSEMSEIAKKSIDFFSASGVD